MAPNDMKQPPDTPDSATPQAAGLGQQAEEALAEDPATIQKMFRELEAHLIEIEMRDEELRRTHAQLAASHARYLDHYELAPVGFVTVSDAGLILEANPAASALLGIARAELIGQPLTRFIFSEHPPPYFQYHSQIFATGTTQTREVRMRDRDGGPSWVLVSATAHDGGGQPLWRVVLTDITGLKQAEARLRESEERFRLLVEQTPDGIFVADSGGRYTDVNQAGAEMLGYTREEILRLTFTDVLAATEIPRLPSQLAALASGTVSRNEWGFRRNGTRRTRTPTTCVSPTAASRKCRAWPCRA